MAQASSVRTHHYYLPDHLIENSWGKKFFIGQFIVKMHLCALDCTPLTLGLSKINALSDLTFANLYALLTAFQIILPLSFVEALFLGE